MRLLRIEEMNLKLLALPPSRGSLREDEAHCLQRRGRREERIRLIGGGLLRTPSRSDVGVLAVALIAADPPASYGLAARGLPGLGHWDYAPDVPDAFHGRDLYLLGCRDHLG